MLRYHEGLPMEDVAEALSSQTECCENAGASRPGKIAGHPGK